MVAYFVSAGYDYISQGLTTERTFEVLIESMVRYEIILQYAMVYFFEESKDANSEYYQVYSVSEYKSFVGNAQGEELSMTTLEYFLDKEVDEIGVTDSKGNPVTRYDVAEFNLKRAINDSIDSQESKFIQASQTGSAEVESRVVPTGVNTVNEDYYDPDYEIYTGLNSLASCGSYEKVAGGTNSTRRQAFNSFLNMLVRNNLITEEDLAVATSKDADKGLAALEYYRSELSAQLQTMLSEKLSDAFEAKAAAGISASYLQQRYEERLMAQKAVYDKNSLAFESDIDSMSDSSFVLYAPEGATDTDGARYGFVYNILLPFSTQQENELNKYKSDNGLTQVELYQKRDLLLAQVQGKDQRDSWFNGATDYSFVAEQAGVTPYSNGNNSNYLFFENSVTKGSGDNAQYQELNKYYGSYPYNGTVSHDPEKNEYKLKSNKLGLTEFLTEMENYMSFAMNNEGYTNTAASVNGSLTFNGKQFELTNGYNNGYGKDLLGEDGKIDYSKFVYYVGKVGGLDFNANNALANNNAAYTALSAFNELQFAYSTDTGCLNTYLGYSVSRYNTDFVDEFEYAAKLAISQGAGTYTVCPSDYGWHIIYCTYTFEEGSVYGDIDWKQYLTNGLIDEEKLTKNSFEYFFYQSIKSSLASDYQNKFETKKINIYDTDDCVTIYENRYSDYTSLEAPNLGTTEDDEHAGHNH